MIPCNCLLHVVKGRERLKKVIKIAKAIGSMGFSIDGFKDMDIRVHMYKEFTHTLWLKYRELLLKDT